MYIKAETYHPGLSIAGKLKAYFELVKFRLTFLVTLSSVFGYLLGNNGNLHWGILATFAAGGFLITSSGVTFNQVLERDLDKLMKRTRNRPLPTGRINVTEALLFALLTFALGMFLLVQFVNVITAVIALLSMVLYAFIYTPLKRIGPVAVFVGAIPGALPPLLGWTAATGDVSVSALIVFMIQFIWQFPHFWAIAWVSDDDYKVAGFKLLPGNGTKSSQTAIQIAALTLLLIPVAWLPYKTGISGLVSAILLTLGGLLFLYPTIKLIRDRSKKTALQIMFSSFLYLPLALLVLLIDKI